MTLNPTTDRTVARKRLLGLNPYILIEAKLSMDDGMKLSFEAEGFDFQQLRATLKEAQRSVRQEQRNRARAAKLLARRRRKAAKLEPGWEPDL